MKIQKIIRYKITALHDEAMLLKEFFRTHSGLEYLENGARWKQNEDVFMLTITGEDATRIKDSFNMQRHDLSNKINCAVYYGIVYRSDNIEHERVFA